METVKDGRRIYDNIRRAVGYIFYNPSADYSGISAAAAFGTPPSAQMLLPVHIVLLELIIDPTCSIVLERQPAEPDIMKRKPEESRGRLLTPQILAKSVLQGIAIAIASFAVYFFHLKNCPDRAVVSRSMGLMVIMISNLFRYLSTARIRNQRSAPFPASERPRNAGGLCRYGADAGRDFLFTGKYVSEAGPLSAGQLAVAVLVSAAAVFW